jgi:hypothetical protein
MAFLGASSLLPLLCVARCCLFWASLAVASFGHRSLLPLLGVACSLACCCLFWASLARSLTVASIGRRSLARCCLFCSNFGEIGPSVEELWASASRMGTIVGLLIGGRNEPWRWRIRRADEATSQEGVRPQRWVQNSAKSARRLRSYGRRRRGWAR